MKKFTLTILVIFCITSTFAQETKDRFRIQVYTGGPSILKSAVGLTNKWQDAVTYKGTPLVGFVGDVRVVDWLSVGVDISHRGGSFEFDVQDSTFYQEIEEKWDIRLAEFVNPFGHYSLKVPRTRVMFNLNFHALPIQSKSDLYFGFGIGYNSVKPKLYLNEREIAFFNRIGRLSLPLAYRTSVGYNYQISRHVGAFAEVGIGGPIVSGGVNVRF